MLTSGRMDVNALNTFANANLWWILALAIWTIPWKGVALWKAGRRGDMIWFIVLLIANTVGILEIFYIFFIANKPKVPKAL